MDISRRSFIGAAALTAAAGCVTNARTPRHRSDYAGIQIGTITYSYRYFKTSGSTLQRLVDSGLGCVELKVEHMKDDIVLPAGKDLKAMMKDGDDSALIALRAKYENAGVFIHTFKDGRVGNMTPEDTDILFRTTKALGAKAITREIPSPKNFDAWKQNAMSLIPFMEKYGIVVAFHNHTQINATTYDGPVLKWHKNFMINFDMGHYTAANDDSAVDFVKKYRDRISSIHLKDRKRKANGGNNCQFGKGDTPLKGVLALLKRERWDIPCDIELEYPMPAGSNAVKEVGICREFCRNAIFESV